MTYPFFTLFPLTLVALPARWIFVAFAIAGMRELGEPARKARIVDLAKTTHRGRVVGLYYLIRGFVTIPAPFVGGILWQQGATWPFILGGTASGLGLLLYSISPKLTEDMS